MFLQAIETCRDWQQLIKTVASVNENKQFNEAIEECETYKEFTINPKLIKRKGMMFINKSTSWSLP